VANEEEDDNNDDDNPSDVEDSASNQEGDKQDAKQAN
jgi:hypothetical protein